MKLAPTLLVAALCLAVDGCSNAGDFESDCALSCDLPDGGALHEADRIGCCGPHDHPSHPGEEGSACTPDWVTSRTQRLCEARTLFIRNQDGSFTSYTCPPSSFRCVCDGPKTYPSYQGCD